MARLKVYEAEIDGLHQWVVAAPNQRAALDALGVNQDLFAQGLARVTGEEAAVEAAQASPGVPLRRAKGSNAPFRPVEAGGDEVWKRAAAAAAAKAAPRKPPSRAPLEKAQAALAQFETAASAEQEKIARARADLDARQAALEERQSARRAELSKAVDEARAAYRAAGGKA